MPDINETEITVDELVNTVVTHNIHTVSEYTVMPNGAVSGCNNNYPNVETAPPISDDRVVCANCASLFDNICGTCIRCETCCACVNCDGCDINVRRGNICGNCERCRGACCECSVCDACGQRRNSQYFECNSCDCCNNCCNCNEEPQEEEADLSPEATGNYGKVWGDPKVFSHFKTFRCKRSAGVEWEYNKANSASEIDHWARTWHGDIHDDGSCGREAVTPPMRGDYIAKILTSLGETFTKAEAKADDRCGIHVHVDTHDFNWQDMYRLLRVYAKVEPILYLVGGQQRINSTFAKPVGDTFMKALNAPDPKDYVLSLVYRESGVGQGKVQHREDPIKKAGGRYRGLNIAPWTFGRKFRKDVRPDTTVEFRIHRNSLDANRIIGWTHLCVQLVDWAYKSSDKDVKNLPKSALRALCVISPESKSYIMKRIKSWRIATRRQSGITRRISVKNGEFKLLLPKS